jgi:hypothetical protein
MLLRLRKVYTEFNLLHDSDDRVREQQERAQMIEPGTLTSWGACTHSDTARPLDTSCPLDKSRHRAAISGSQLQAKTARARCKVALEAPAIITSLERRARRRVGCNIYCCPYRGGCCGAGQVAPPATAVTLTSTPCLQIACTLASSSNSSLSSCSRTPCVEVLLRNPPAASPLLAPPQHYHPPQQQEHHSDRPQDISSFR